MEVKLTAPGDGLAGGVSKELPGEAEVGTLQGLWVMSGMWLQSLGLELKRDTGPGVISEQMVSSLEQTGGDAPGGRWVPGGKWRVWRAGRDLDSPVGVTSPKATASQRREGAEKVWTQQPVHAASLRHLARPPLHSLCPPCPPCLTCPSYHHPQLVFSPSFRKWT